jgi:glutamate transport system ATP-binding protein
LPSNLDSVGLLFKKDEYPMRLTADRNNALLSHAPLIQPKSCSSTNLCTPDPELIGEVLNVIKVAKDNMTMLVVTHEMGLRAVADRVLVMADGEIIEDENPATFSTTPKTLVQRH